MHRPIPAAALAGAFACALAACDGAAVTPAGDAAPLDAAPARDAAPDAAVDATLDPDAAPDAALDPDAAPDAALDPDAAPDPALAPCPAVPSRRAEGALRVAGCRLVRDGDAARLPRAVVVSADSLARVGATPLHEPPQYAALAAAGVEVVWLLVLWQGIEPSPRTYNGAYLGRVCQQARWAADAGLDVVLSMTQHRWGPALGGHGMPPWATPADLPPVPADAGPEHPSLDAAWRAFWRSEAMPSDLAAAWDRLFATCAEDEAHGIDGIEVIAAPIGPPEAAPAHAALIADVRAAAEARLGPLIAFEGPLWTPAGLRWPPAPPEGDRVRTLPGWGPARWPGAAPPPAGWREAARDAALLGGDPLWLVGVGGETPDAMAAALAETEAAGLVGVIWQDGFGTPAGLRDEDGIPGPLWPVALDRPHPERVAGRPLGWTLAPDAITLRWAADGTDQGLGRFAMAGRPPGAPRLSPDGPFAWFTDYDPATDLLSIYVEGAPGVVELTVPLVSPEAL